MNTKPEVSPYPTCSTPFPNWLIDSAMPALRDTEWRILCVIVRQTIGWKEGRGRKRSDWLSQRQLMRRTGRASAAVSSAIERLVCLGYVNARAETGESLTTSAARRRHAHRILYSLTTEVC